MRFFLSLFLTVVSLEAHAQASFDPTRVTCAEAKAIIKREGAVVLRWNAPGSGVPRYGRYVRNSAYCSLSQTAKSNFVPTRDRRSCGVSVCGPKNND